MSINFLGLRTVGYKANDITKAKEWYSNVLGIKPYFDEPFYVGFNVGGYELGLQPTDEAVAAGVSGSTTYWGVDDVAEAYDALLTAGATSVEKPTDVGDGIIVASVRDPWGNVVGMIYNPHFSLA